MDIRLGPPTPPALKSTNPQSWAPADPVKVVEGCPEFVELLLAQALGISSQYLVLHLIDSAGDGREQLLPAYTDVLGNRDKSVGGWCLATNSTFTPNLLCDPGQLFHPNVPLSLSGGSTERLPEALPSLKFDDLCIKC